MRCSQFFLFPHYEGKASFNITEGGGETGYYFKRWRRLPVSTPSPCTNHTTSSALNMSRASPEVGILPKDDEDENMNDIDLDFEKLGRGFPTISLPSFWSTSSVDRTDKSDYQGFLAKDFSHWSRKFQMNTFIDDLQKGLSFSNALTRLQTIKALMEQTVGNAIHSNVDDDSEDADNGEEPIGIIPVMEPKTIPAYNDMVIPQDKNPQLLEDHLQALTVFSNEEIKDHNALRNRIKYIQNLDIVPVKKALMMQKLMMGKHYDQGSAGNEEQDLDNDNDGTIPSEVLPDEKIPTYHESGVMGCPHYQRNCKLQCHQCHRWHTCRFCHDEAVAKSANPHTFQRNKTKWVICMRCLHVQKPKKDCENCQEEMAIYFCDKCKLYDNDEMKDIYHCDKCGICRLGLGLGQDFFHCDGCQACLSIELQGNHKCIERATMSNCPICGDYMFTSVRPVVYMSPCGHAIHQHCFDEYTKHSYKCPHCQVTVLNMDAQFRVLDSEIEEQPLPEPYCNWLCVISCNDCKARSTCKYHILGLRCNNCSSYNTNQLKLLKPEEKSDVNAAPNQLDDEYCKEDEAVHKSATSLRDMRNELLQGNFQREEVSPFINVNNEMLTNIDAYLNGYFNESSERSSHPGQDEIDHDSHNLVNMTSLLRSHEDQELTSTSMGRMGSLAEKVRKFIAEAPPQLSVSETFQRFLQTSHQGLSSGDEDDDYINNERVLDTDK